MPTLRGITKSLSKQIAQAEADRQMLEARPESPARDAALKINREYLASLREAADALARVGGANPDGQPPDAATKLH